VYIERVAVNSPSNIRKTKEAIEKAFKVQMENRGFSLIEILSPCPTNWRLSAKDSMQWIERYMIPYFPLGVIKEI